MRVDSPAGFTLIEVLVALFVLSVGLLGAAAMQSRARAMRMEARQHAQATQLAVSHAEKMRANRITMAAADGANPYLGTDYDSATGVPAQPSRFCYGDTTCTAQELARFDIYETELALHSAFGHARMVVCRDDAPWDAAASSLLWTCSSGSGAPVVIKIGWRARRGASDIVPGIAYIAAGGSP